MKDIDFLSPETQALIQVALDSQREQLGTTTEDDVIAARDKSYRAAVLQGIPPEVLLEFFRRMIDQRLGREET